jgi:hypothetical protein
MLCELTYAAHGCWAQVCCVNTDQLTQNVLTKDRKFILQPRAMPHLVAAELNPGEQQELDAEQGGCRGKVLKLAGIVPGNVGACTAEP